MKTKVILKTTFIKLNLIQFLKILNQVQNDKAYRYILNEKLVLKNKHGSFTH
jgi:hypothetical protein